MSVSYKASVTSSPAFAVCPFSVVLFVATAAITTLSLRQKQMERRQGSKQSSSDSSATNNKKDSHQDDLSSLPACTVVFVLGAPGSGKGTQCQLLVERLDGGGGDWTHLSAGDLLRAERNNIDTATPSSLRDTIQACMAAGQLVPSQVTCQLIETAMLRAYQTNKCTKFLIDGFPRSLENLKAWTKSSTASKHTVAFCLNLECPQEVLIGRLLERGQQTAAGRADDTPQVISKRFESHTKETAPIIQTYKDMGKLKTIASDKPVEQVYQQVAACFKGL